MKVISTKNNIYFTATYSRIEKKWIAAELKSGEFMTESETNKAFRTYEAAVKYCQEMNNKH